MLRNQNFLRDLRPVLLVDASFFTDPNDCPAGTAFLWDVATTCEAIMRDPKCGLINIYTITNSPEKEADKLTTSQLEYIRRITMLSMKYSLPVFTFASAFYVEPRGKDAGAKNLKGRMAPLEILNAVQAICHAPPIDLSETNFYQYLIQYGQ